MARKPITHHFLAARDRPTDLVALRFRRHKSWLEFSWQEYYRRAEAVGCALTDFGIVPGDRIAILANTRWEWAALDFAILGVGAVTVPIYHSSRPDEIEFILGHSGARILFVEDSTQLRKWESINKKCRDIEKVVVMQARDEGEHHPHVIDWDDLIAQGAKAALAAKGRELFAKALLRTQLKDLATIVYTSGTTGLPKGVQLTHLQILAEVEGIQKAFPISTQDSTLSFLPYAHVLGRVELWLHTYVGFSMSFAESIERLRPNLRDIRPTAMIGVPRIFEKIFSGVMAELSAQSWRGQAVQWLERQNSGSWFGARSVLLDRVLYRKLRDGLGGRLRFAVSGGAPLEPKIAEFFHRAGILLLEGYGLTETTAAIAVNTPKAFRFGTVGRPLHNVDIQLAADGEILVKGDVVMSGYFKDSDKESAVFKDGYLLTGDIGEWTDDGFLRITDRKKDLIKTSGGKYVAPQKLEGLLKLEPLISHALIHGDRKKYIVALITLDEAATKKMARTEQWKFRDYHSLSLSHELRDHVRKIVAQVNSQLASYETIKAFAILDHDFTVENGELTPSLKVKRRVCDERYQSILQSLY